MKILKTLLLTFTVLGCISTHAAQSRKIEGTLTQKLINLGNSGANVVIGIEQLHTGDFVVVRMRGDNPFHPNEELQKHLGKQASCDGFLIESNYKILVEAVCVFSN